MKKLPYSIETEQALLFCIIADVDILNKVTVDENDFYDDRNKVIFKVLKTLYEYKKDIDIIIIRKFIQDKKIEKDVWGMLYIIEEVLDRSENTNYWETYDSIIKGDAQRRNIILESRKIEQIWFDDDISNIFNNINNLKTSIEIKKHKWNDIISLTNSFFDYLDIYKKQWWLWYAWPYIMLDKYIGWIIPWKVFTITAYSWVWKSNFSYSYMADALKKWKKVLVFSLEVQKEMLFNLLLKAYYNVSQKDIVKDNFSIKLEDFQNLIVYDNLYKLEEIKATTKLEKPDIIFIDFIQNVQAKWNSEYEQMTKIAQELQRIAIETNITIFSISQANNDSRFKESNKIQPKWSWAIFASSDVILALSRDWKNLNLNILKNKYWMSDRNFLVIPDFRKLQFKITEQLEDYKEEVETDYFNK